MVGDGLECGLYSRLGVQAQLISQVDILLVLFILTESIVTLFQYVFVGLKFEPKHTQCHLPELPLLLNSDSQCPQASPHECQPSLLMLVSPQLPSGENACLILVMCRHDGHSVQTSIKVLTLDEAGPLCVRSSHFEVPGFRAQTIHYFNPIGSCPHIIFPHIEAKLHFSLPEIC